jgi:hypothetical protein
MTTRLNVRIVSGNSCYKNEKRIPTSDPALIVVNHPNRVMGGLAVGVFTRSVRLDFKILAKSIF